MMPAGSHASDPYANGESTGGSSVFQILDLSKKGEKPWSL